MKALLIPVFLQVALTFGITLALALSRVAAAKSGAVKLKDIALPSTAWPDNVRQIGASYQNQLELPTLFYALVALALTTGQADGVLTAGAFVFVLTRFGHAYIHLTSNHVLKRFKFFAAGVTVLLLMWVYFAARVLLA